MAARRQVTNKLRGQHRTAAKADKTKIVDRVVATTGMGRWTARRMLTGPRLPESAEQVDGRTLRPRGFGDDAPALLEHEWALMGMPCGTYLVAMVEVRLPLLAGAGDLDRLLATEAAVAELKAMSAATVDRIFEAGPGCDADQGHRDDDTFCAAAQFDRHPRLRRGGAREPRGDRGRHRGALRPELDRRVRPHLDDDRPGDRLDREPLDRPPTPPLSANPAHTELGSLYCHLDCLAFLISRPYRGELG
jgi:hypothetical protein